MPAALLRIWHARGVALTQGYGLTEASPNVLCLADEDAAPRGSAGRPYPHVACRRRRPRHRRTARRRGRGRAAGARPGVFAGYFRDPAATAAALVDGWLRTGDLVRRDADGYFTVVDRLKDIYISGGENVAPAEVEAALWASAVADVAVVGVPDTLGRARRRLRGGAGPERPRTTRMLDTRGAAVAPSRSRRSMESRTLPRSTRTSSRGPAPARAGSQGPEAGRDP